MAHDPATARDYYYKEDAQRQAAGIHERMRRAYDLGSSTSGADALHTPSDLNQLPQAQAAAAASGFSQPLTSMTSSSASSSSMTLTWYTDMYCQNIRVTDVSPGGQGPICYADNF